MEKAVDDRFDLAGNDLGGSSLIVQPLNLIELDTLEVHEFFKGDE